MPPTFGMVPLGHGSDLYSLTKDGKAVGIPMRKANAEHLVYWLEQNWFALIYQAPEPDIYTPRGAHPCGRSIADSNAEFQDMEAAIAERFDTATIQKGR